MNSWFYLALSLALLLVFARGEGRKKTEEIWEFWIDLALGTTILVTIDTVLNALFWHPQEKESLRMPSFFLWALVLDYARSKWRKGGKEPELQLFVSPFLLALVGFTLWTVGLQGGIKGYPFLVLKRIPGGVGLCLAAGLAEWLLQGLRDRVRLARVPKVFEGVPILFFLAALLYLAFQGLAPFLAGAHL